jgi:hypothetical protein
MGCDWYTIKSYTGVGAMLESDAYANLNNHSKHKYKCKLLADSEDGDSVIVKYFIYDPSTLVKNKISVPGPYEIFLSDHSTSFKIIEGLYESEIHQMKNETNLPCVYWSILTTMGVENYMDADKFKDYYGYP